MGDGTDPSGWTGGPWRVADGYMEVNGTGDITSKAVFGDGRLHVEFAKAEQVTLPMLAQTRENTPRVV